MTGNLTHEVSPWAMVPRWIIQHNDLTSGAVRVYAALSDMAGRDRPAWPSHRTLAGKCNMSISSVRRHIRELVDVGAIRVTERYKPDSEGQTSNLYEVMHNVGKSVNNEHGPTTENRGVSTGEHGPYPLVTIKEEPLNNNHISVRQKTLKQETSLLT